MSSTDNSSASPPDSPLRLPVLLAVLVVGAAVIFAQLGKFPLFNPDEALYAEPAREMLEIKEYITTYLNYVVRFTKPPLVIWAMALSMNLFGVNEFAARFFGAATGVALIGVTYLFASRYISTTAAFLAGFSLIMAPLYLGTAREAITDMPLAFFMASAQLAFFHAFFQKRKVYALLGFAMVGLSIMTKGPVGMVLPLGILFAFHLLRGDLKEAWKAYSPVLGLILTAVIAVPWFAVEIYVTKGAYFQEFIMRENFQRFTAVVDAHKQPVWYHLAAMVVGFMPFSVFLPGLVKDYLTRLTLTLKTPSESIWERYRHLASSLRNLGTAESLMVYSALWAFITLAFYSASVSKLLPYTLPAFPALALMVSHYIDRQIKRERFLPLALPLVALVALYGGVGLVAPHLTGRLRDCPAELPPLVIGFAGFGAGVTFLSILALRLKKMRLGMCFFAAGTTLGLAYYAVRILPVVSAKWEGGLPELSAFAGQSSLPIIVYDMRKPGVPFYARRQVENINNHDVFLVRLGQLEKAYVLTRTKRLEALSSIAGLKPVGSQGSFTLLLWGQVKESQPVNK